MVVTPIAQMNACTIIFLMKNSMSFMMMVMAILIGLHGMKILKPSSMSDRMTPEQRHKCMSHIRSKDTKPELKVRQWLWRHGYRYRLNVKGVPGKPDIVMRKYKTAIFVNGCFWHGHGVEFKIQNSK